MADEIVDLVNEKDEIIGEEWKSVCHEKGLWHRVSSVLIVNDEGKILLQKRAKGKIGEGYFDNSAGGHVTKGESYEQAAYKELGEELSIETELKQIKKGIFENCNIDQHKIRHAHTLFVGKHNGPFKIQEEEVESVKFYSVEEIKDILEKEEKITKGCRLCLNAYLESIDGR